MKKSAFGETLTVSISKEFELGTNVGETFRRYSISELDCPCTGERRLIQRNRCHHMAS